MQLCWPCDTIISCGRLIVNRNSTNLHILHILNKKIKFVKDLIGKPIENRAKGLDKINQMGYNKILRVTCSACPTWAEHHHYLRVPVSYPLMGGSVQERSFYARVLGVFGGV